MTVTKTTLAAYHSLPLSTVLEKVLEAIEAAGESGLTNDELAEVTGIEYRTVTPRFKQLESRGLAFRAGDTRPGRSGRGQLVMRHAKWAATTPVVKLTPKKNPFLEGMKYAAKIVLSCSDLTTAKRELGDALRKKVATA